MAMFVTDKDGEETSLDIGLNRFQIRKYWFDAKIVQASGRELNHILNNFEGIPTRNDASTCTWYGDWAKFILANW